MSWDPNQYLRYADYRLRPALDLLARIPLETPHTVTDLGCGPGNVTAKLAQRWPDAKITGLDSSQDMLDKAAAEIEAPINWVRGDIAKWRPGAPQDVIYSNAALQWLDGHEALFGNLASYLSPGGVLAVQMPRNHDAPSHASILKAAGDGPWAHKIRDLLKPVWAGKARFYYGILAAHFSHIDIWETEYSHVLEGVDPVLGWMKGTALRPILAALDEGEEQAAFLAALGERFRVAYPPGADGKTLFPFKRLFMVALR